MKQSHTEKAYREGYGDSMATHAKTLTVGEMDNAWNNSVAKNGIPEGRLTDDDKQSIYYFLTEEDDVTRWCGWEDKKAQVFAEFPELKDAFMDRDKAERQIQNIANEIGE